MSRLTIQVRECPVLVPPNPSRDPAHLAGRPLGPRISWTRDVDSWLIEVYWNIYYVTVELERI
jgi:hypothetical protein